MDQQDKDTLEALIDKYTLEETLNNLGLICLEKSEHIMENWQDPQLAKVWGKKGHKIMNLKCTIFYVLSQEKTL